MIDTAGMGYEQERYYLEQEIARLRAALEILADDKNWDEDYYGDYFEYKSCKSAQDFAQEALKDGKAQEKDSANSC